jgi:hypothetical protein
VNGERCASLDGRPGSASQYVRFRVVNMTAKPNFADNTGSDVSPIDSLPDVTDEFGSNTVD